VTVPFFIDPESLTLGAGRVSVSLKQEFPGGSAIYGPIDNFSIGELPSSAGDPGQVTLQVLDQFLLLAGQAPTQWTRRRRTNRRPVHCGSHREHPGGSTRPEGAGRTGRQRPGPTSHSRQRGYGRCVYRPGRTGSDGPDLHGIHGENAGHFRARNCPRNGTGSRLRTL